MAIEGFEYQAPTSLDEALSLLDRQGEPCKVLAGGTDLIVQIKNGLVRPVRVVDVKNIPELNRLEWVEGKSLHIGAAVPLGKLVMFPVLQEKFDILAQACSMIGSTQIRNRATVGGNVCNAAPSADSAPPLLCLEAKAVTSSHDGTRVVPLTDFFLGPGETVLRDVEILLEIEVPAPPASSAGCYLRHSQREEMDIAVVGVAAFLVPAPDGKKLQDARIALGAVASTPLRIGRAETVLKGKTPTRTLIDEAAKLAGEAASPISDIRGSAGYRREMVNVLTRRALNTCCEKLGIGL